MPRKYLRKATTLTSVAYLVSGNFKVVCSDYHNGLRIIDEKPGYILWSESLTENNDLYYKYRLSGLNMIQKSVKYLEYTCSKAIEVYSESDMNLVYREIVFAKCWDNYLYYPIAWCECDCAKGKYNVHRIKDMNIGHCTSKLIPHYHSMSCTYVPKPGAELYKYISSTNQPRVTPHKDKHKGATKL